VTSPTGVSAFGAGGTPSAGRVAAALRDVADDPSVQLGEATVAQLCERLREAAAFLGDLPLTDAPADKPEAFRYLLSLLNYTVDAVVFHSDPLEPMFSPPHRNHQVDWGAASPDGVYRRTAIRADLAYRVWGRLGNADYFTLDFRTTGPPFTILRDDIETGDDGSFEAFLGGERREVNWWPLTDGTTGLLVREFFTDWLAAEKSQLRIECLDGAIAPRAEHRAARVAAEFDAIGDWIRDGGVKWWAERSRLAGEKVRNGFQPEMARTETKLPVYTYGLWDLRPDEALLIELPDPQARFWGLQLASSLWHTLDYANRLTTFNCGQAVADADGVFRFVLAHEDPGVRSWLDTTGLERGIMILRHHRAQQLEVPRTRVVPHADVAELLPDAERVDGRQRLAQIAERREGVSRMVCD
jgi:hypothetical protein